ncbi:MAG TPA: Asp-tRNA(Asn)/Glu-tRNA(Gln) amidotransferase subunit GatC [Fimbriimonadaceae bacterium]|nr:Asp-tRNA(Asn)/Glu-tRNA(Gln) amidotransferase subunit GatC [Fimbriimonadaceae bacterium]
MPISLEEVRHVARLARLELDEAEVLALQGELNALLGHFADLQDIDVSGIDPAFQAMSLQNVWAQDVIQRGFTREQALRNAPTSKGGLFVVPTIIEG